MGKPFTTPHGTYAKRRPESLTLGDYWLDETGEVWQQDTYCAEPTVGLRNVKTGERVAGAVGAPIFDRFTHLVRENPSG